jgi:hypothetical protein
VIGGTIVNTGIVSQQQSTDLKIETAIRLSLGVNASGQSDVLALTIESDGSARAMGQLGWVEIV